MKTLAWKSNPIVNVISTRLGMQSTQRSLEQEFGVNLPDISALKSYIYTMDNWDKAERNKFIKLVGGTANFKKTQEYLGLFD
jgi:hypothetical protein